jgi:hypothetical protein
MRQNSFRRWKLGEISENQHRRKVGDINSWERRDK